MADPHALSSAPPAPARKLPLLEPETAFYWTSGADGVLRIQRCRDCATYQQPPFPRCASCGSEAVAPHPVSGKGRIASYTVNHEAWLPGLAVPFVFAVVELAEQAQLYVFTNLLAPVEAARVGLPVTVEFERHEDVWLPMFRLDEEGARHDLAARKLACITGAAQSEVGRPSTRTALQLTADACLAAIADAGLAVCDIDGIATYPGKSSEGGGIAPVSPSEAAAVLGIEPRWILASAEGFSHMAPIFNAITAIACGLARHVVVFRSVAQATARLASRQSTLLGGSRSSRVEGNNAWTVPFNAHSPINAFALYAQAYFEKYGATEAQLGAIAVNNRRNAGHNPNAIYRKPLSLEDYLAARVISTPLRLFDCDSHIDGATAIVVSHRDAAKDLKNPPLHIESMGMAVGGLWVGQYEGDFTSMPAAHRAGRMLWERTDLKPADMDCAQIYDGFSIHVWMWMEALGLVPPGEACRFVEGGSRIAIDGELPLNTGGGQLSAGRFHGYGHIHEATVQLWGRGGGRQVADPRTCIISNGGYGYGAMILRRD